MTDTPKWVECFCLCHKDKSAAHTLPCCYDMCRICGKHIRGDAIAFEAHTKSHGHYDTLPTPK